MRIRRGAWRAHSLLNRATGFAAEDVRRALGVSPTGRIEALERRIAELERHLALVHRHFAGVELGDYRTPVVPDGAGWIQMYSPDDTVTIQRDPNKKPNVIALKAVLPAGTGCTKAWATIRPNVGTQIAADNCDDAFCDIGETSTYLRPRSDGLDPGSGAGTIERLGWIVFATYQMETVLQTNGHILVRLDDGTYCQVPVRRIQSPAPAPIYPCP